MKITGQDMEKEIFQFVDGMKELVSAELWQNILLDCSKNEVLVLWLLFRQREVNMSQVAEYIHVPLNTATGIIARMEKKNLVMRERSVQDKRVVTISLAEQGNKQIQSLMKEFSFYAMEIAASFSEEEMRLLFRMLDKVKDIMKKERLKETEKKQIRKITIE